MINDLTKLSYNMKENVKIVMLSLPLSVMSLNFVQFMSLEHNHIHTHNFKHMQKLHIYILRKTTSETI